MKDIDVDNPRSASKKPVPKTTSAQNNMAYQYSDLDERPVNSAYLYKKLKPASVKFIRYFLFYNWVGCISICSS
jgi:hypothetical protein